MNAMISLQFKLYLLLGVIAVCGGFYANYKYQRHTISVLEKQLVEANDKAIDAANKATALEHNIISIKDTITTFQDNQIATKKDTDKLKKSVTRLDTIKAKPGLVSIKIEKSYKKMHLEKACYSGNKEACDVLKK